MKFNVVKKTSHIFGKFVKFQNWQADWLLKFNFTGLIEVESIKSQNYAFELKNARSCHIVALHSAKQGSAYCV
jgi:hypothetical protein